MEAELLGLHTLPKMSKTTIKWEALRGGRWRDGTVARVLPLQQQTDPEAGGGSEGSGAAAEGKEEQVPESTPDLEMGGGGGSDGGEAAGRRWEDVEVKLKAGGA